MSLIMPVTVPVATRRENILGTNIFPNFTETLQKRLVPLTIARSRVRR